MADIKDIWVYANNIIRSSRQLINEQLKPLNLSSSEGNILLHLLTQHHPLTQDQIVAQLDISKPAVSKALNSLQQKRYVTRTAHPDDKRAKSISLTDKAHEIAPQISQIYNDVLSIATRVVTDQEVADFLDLFSRVSASFTKACSEKRHGRPHHDQ